MIISALGRTGTGASRTPAPAGVAPAGVRRAEDMRAGLFRTPAAIAPSDSPTPPKPSLRGRVVRSGFSGEKTVQLQQES